MLTWLLNVVLATSSTVQAAGGGLGPGAWIGIAVTMFVLGIAVGIVVPRCVTR